MSGIQSVSVSAAQTFATVGTQSQQSLQPFANLDLSEAQRTQLRSIFTAAKQTGTSPADVKQQVDAVLTPTQQKTLAGDIKADGHAGHRGQHRHHDASSPSTDVRTAGAPQTSATAVTSTVLDAVTNVQNQVSAANSTLLETLQHNVLAGTDTAAVNTTPSG